MYLITWITTLVHQSPTFDTGSFFDEEARREKCFICYRLLIGLLSLLFLSAIACQRRFTYTPPNLRTRLQPNFTFICHPAAAGPTVYERLFQACFPIFSTDCLELAVTNSSHQRFSVCF